MPPFALEAARLSLQDKGEDSPLGSKFQAHAKNASVPTEKDMLSTMLFCDFNLHFRFGPVLDNVHDHSNLVNG